MEQKLAVISDVHGNYKALEAVLAFLWKDGRVQLLQENLAAKGEQGGTGVWQRESSEEMDNALEENGGNKACIPALRLCHGTPGLVRGNVDLDKRLQKQVMEQLDTEYLLGGHSHKQEIHRQDGKLYVNPGSLGLALDGKGGHAHFAILTLCGDTGTGKVSQNLAASNGEALQNARNNPTFRNRADLQNHQEFQKLYWEPRLYDIPYDMEAYLADFREAGLAGEGRVLAASVEKTIRTGVNWFYLTILRVKELSGGLPLPQTSEQVWEQAAMALDIALPTTKW